MYYFIEYEAKFNRKKVKYKIPVDSGIIENLDSYRKQLDLLAWKAFKGIFNSTQFVILAVHQIEKSPFISSKVRLKSYGQKG